MNLIEKILLLLAVFLLEISSYASAQNNTLTDTSNNRMAISSVPMRVKRPKPITRENSLGIRLNTDGYTLFYEKGIAKSKDSKRIEQIYDNRVFQVEFSEKKHPKELKMYGWDRDRQSDKKYIYGKINNFYAFKVNYGNKRMIAGKPYPNTVSVHWVYAGGVALGILKPYYVTGYNSKGQLEPMKFDKENEPYFLNNFRVVGYSGFSQGIGETKIIPGVHLKTSLQFDYSNKNQLVSAIETGLSAEVYTSKIELMANQKPNLYFVNLYVSAQFGKRHR